MRFGEVHEDDLAAMLVESDHPIYSVELYAVWAALTLWSDLLRDTYTVVYVDNTAAQAALVKGSSGVDTGDQIIQGVGEFEASLVCRPWFSWVPTHSNPADPPSRGATEALRSTGASGSTFRKRMLQ